MIWVTLCKIKAKSKTRQRPTLERCQIIATAVRDGVIHLPQIKEYPDDLVLGKFMETKWDLSHDVPKNMEKRKRCLLMTSRYKTVRKTGILYHSNRVILQDVFLPKSQGK